ncbi:hypothetical protein MTO96_008188 [Rhipicephalus appendiculatus]
MDCLHPVNYKGFIANSHFYGFRQCDRYILSFYFRLQQQHFVLLKQVMETMRMRSPITHMVVYHATLRPKARCLHSEEMTCVLLRPGEDDSFRLVRTLRPLACIEDDSHLSMLGEEDPPDCSAYSSYLFQLHRQLLMRFSVTVALL